MVEPFPTPSFPAVAFAIAGTHQVPPDLLFYPVFDHRETFARVADSKVVHPLSQDRID